jgi:hypothetical protein
VDSWPAGVDAINNAVTSTANQDFPGAVDLLRRVSAGVPDDPPLPGMKRHALFHREHRLDSLLILAFKRLRGSQTRTTRVLQGHGLETAAADITINTICLVMRTPWLTGRSRTKRKTWHQRRGGDPQIVLKPMPKGVFIAIENCTVIAFLVSNAPAISLARPSR